MRGIATITGLAIGLAAPAAQAGFTVKGSPPGSVTVTQTSDGGGLLVRLGGDELMVTEGLGQVFPGVPKNLKVVMLPDTTGPLTIDLDQDLPGNLDLRVADVVEVDLSGDANGVGGNVKIQGRGGSTLVDLSPNAELRVGKSLIVNLGDGEDRVRVDGNDLDVELALKLTGVEMFDVGEDADVGKNLTWKGKKSAGAAQLVVQGSLDVEGSIKYIGGASRDQFDAFGGTLGVGGNLMVNLGPDDVAGVQLVDLRNFCIIEGNVSIKAGKSDGTTRYDSDELTTIGGNLSIKFSGPGMNDADIEGEIDGKAAKYNGGPGNDSVFYDARGKPTKLTVKLGSGNDHVHIDPGITTELSSAKLDGGKNTDTFSVPLGPPYPLTLKNFEAGI